MMIERSDPSIVKNTVYHTNNDIEVRKANQMGFDIGFGVVLKDKASYEWASKIPEGYGRIIAY